LRKADLVAALARIEQELIGHREILVDVQKNAKATNGRVTKLERAWWYARGFAGAIALAVTVLGATGHLHIH
jgi:hypothetical protein